LFNWGRHPVCQAMPVSVSPISRTASLLIIALGVFTLFVGQVTGILADSVAGAAFIILGIILNRVLYRLGRQVKQSQ